MTDRTMQTWLALGRTSMHRLLRRTRLVFSQDPGQQVDRDVELAGVQALAESAGQLKGGLAKAAQLLGYLEGPEGSLGPEAQAALSTLFDRIPAGDPVAIRLVVQEDLGRAPEQLFATWEDRPFAAASLGEVHGATSHAGMEYAVKVQYPGIAAALLADLESDAVAHRLAGAEMGRAVSQEALWAIKAAILQEVDYQAEARSLGRFREAFSADPQVVIPRPYPDLSSARVLTADRLRGRTLSDFARDASAGARSAAAATLFRFGFGAAIVHGLFNADPNPGNYLVLDDGQRVGFLDFGCCVELREEVVTCERVLWQSLLAGDAEVLRYALHREGLILQPIEFDSDRYRQWEHCLAQPFLTHDFTWTPEFARQLALHTSALVRGQRFTLPSGSILLWRQRLGLAAILGRLRARADFRGMLLGMLRAVDMAPAGVK